MIKNWENQAEANRVAFLMEADYQKRRQVIAKLSDAFKKEKIEWALSCSANLFFKGITDDFDDLDIMVDEADIEKVETLMKKLGAIQHEVPIISECKSNAFLEFTLDDVDIDIIAGFRVITFGTKYLYEYNSAEVEMYSLLDMQIPLIATEAQLLLYAMMEGWQKQRQLKRTLIQGYIKDFGVNHLEIFEKGMKQELPPWIKLMVLEILNKR